MTQFTQKQAMRRYLSRFALAMSLYVIGLIGGTFVWKQFETPPIWLSILAVLAATLPLLGFFWVWLGYVRECDEYQRFQALWAFAIAGCITASVAFAMGFANTFELVGHIAAYWYAILFIVLQGLTTAIRAGRAAA